MRRIFRNMKQTLVIGLAMISFLRPVTIAEGQVTKAKKEPQGEASGTSEAKNKRKDELTTTKSIQGEACVIRPTYISVIYEKIKNRDGIFASDHEMVFPIDENTALSHVKSLEQIKEGDTVEIIYDETSWVDENGIGRIEREAKEIRFIRPAVKGLISQ